MKARIRFQKKIPPEYISPAELHRREMAEYILPKGQTLEEFDKEQEDKIEMDKIKRPPHYNKGSIECWDYIIDQKMGYLAGNVVKYMTRYQHKGDKGEGLDDLKKARAYLNKLISGGGK